jgi:hypothetical protein
VIEKFKYGLIAFLICLTGISQAVGSRSGIESTRTFSQQGEVYSTFDPGMPFKNYCELPDNDFKLSNFDPHLLLKEVNKTVRMIANNESRRIKPSRLICFNTLLVGLPAVTLIFPFHSFY